LNFYLVNSQYYGFFINPGIPTPALFQRQGCGYGPDAGIVPGAAAGRQQRHGREKNQKGGFFIEPPSGSFNDR